MIYDATHYRVWFSLSPLATQIDQLKNDLRRQGKELEVATEAGAETKRREQKALDEAQSAEASRAALQQEVRSLEQRLTAMQREHQRALREKEFAAMSLSVSASAAATGGGGGSAASPAGSLTLFPPSTRE